MPTPTTTYSLSKPTVGGDDNAWGTELNANMDKLDDLLDGTLSITPNLATGWEVGGVAVTASADELNILDGVTASTAEINILDGVTATTTELNYVVGVTSAIQTQIDGKQAADATLTSLSGLSLSAGDVLYATAADTVQRLAIGTAGQVLTVNSGATAPEWVNGVTTSAVLAATAGAAFGAVGTYAMVHTSGLGFTEGSTIAGSALQPAGILWDAPGTVSDDDSETADITKGGSALSGTWRIMGRVNKSSANTRARATLALRIS